MRYRLTLAAGQEAIAKRLHRVHARSCPVYRTISRCVDISTELTLTIEK